MSELINALGLALIVLFAGAYAVLGSFAAGAQRQAQRDWDAK